MRADILAAAIVVLYAAPLHAVRITGELVAERGTGIGVVTLQGPNFSIRTVFSRFLSSFAPLESECNLFGCGPGDMLFLDGMMLGSDMVASGTVDGVFYPQLSHGDAATALGSFFRFYGPPIAITNSLVYEAPVFFRGALTGYIDTNTCLLCRELNGDETPLPVSGSGRATLTLTPLPPDAPSEGGPWRFERIVYQFEVPEPSTFTLMCAALAAYVIFRVALRYRAQRAENR